MTAVSAQLAAQAAAPLLGVWLMGRADASVALWVIAGLAVSAGFLEVGPIAAGGEIYAAACATCHGGGGGGGEEPSRSG